MSCNPDYTLPTEVEQHGTKVSARDLDPGAQVVVLDQRGNVDAQGEVTGRYNEWGQRGVTIMCDTDGPRVNVTPTSGRTFYRLDPSGPLTDGSRGDTHE